MFGEDFFRFRDARDAGVKGTAVLALQGRPEFGEVIGGCASAGFAEGVEVFSASDTVEVIAGVALRSWPAGERLCTAEEGSAFGAEVSHGAVDGSLLSTGESWAAFHGREFYRERRRGCCAHGGFSVIRPQEQSLRLTSTGCV